MTAPAAAVPRTPGTPVAYLRRSHAQASNTGAVSHEIQMQKINEMAGADAPRLRLIEDWGRSGRREKQSQRPAYAELRAMLERGEVSTIYTWTLSRLARSLTELNDLAHLCAAKGVPIKCADGFSPDVSTPTGRLVLSLLGAIHQYQAEWTAEAAASSLAVRRANGGVVGSTPYGVRAGEDTTVLAAAFKEAGSFLGAAIALNAAGITTRRGNRWSATTLGRVLRHPNVGAAVNAPRKGIRAGRATRVFSGLLRCYCGSILTSMPNRPGVAYYCRRAPLDPTHPYPRTILEHKLLPWAQAEVIRGLGSHMLEIRYADQNVAVRAALEARRARLMEAYLDMRFDKVVLDRMLTETDTELAALGQVDRAIAAVALKPAIRWDAPAGEINQRLRELWRSVQLGPDLRPVSADWYLSLEESAAAEDALAASLQETW